MKKSIKIFLALLFIPTTIFAQVSIITGGANPSIPLYTYSANNRLSVSVGLQYTASNGIKVNEVAHEVGLGWKLNAGGRITRVLADKPDDQYGSLGTFTQKGRMYIKNSTLIKNCKSDVGIIYPEYNGFDREADAFNFEFNGHSGTFVIGTKKSGESEYPIYCISDSRIKVRLIEEDMSSSNVITRISNFIITDVDGTIYYFRDKELSELFTTDVNKASTPPPPIVIVSLNGDAPQPSTVTLPSYHTGKYIVNNWYLSQIVNPYNQHSISFIYDTYNTDFTYLKLPIKTQVLDNSTLNPTKDNYTIVDQHFTGIMKRLIRISVDDKEDVYFNYLNNRLDIPGETMLSEIKVINKYKSAIVQDYRLNYQYYYLQYRYDTTAANAQSSDKYPFFRLCLKSVENIVGGTTPLFSFDYVPGIIPERGSMWQDRYGYFIGIWANGRKLNDFFDDTKRAPTSASGIAIGMLQRINYGAGGYLEYAYENNTFFNDTTDIITAGVRVASTTIFDGVDHSHDNVTTYKYRREDNSSSGLGYEKAVYTNDVTTQYYTNGSHLISTFIAYTVNLYLSTYTGSGALAIQQTTSGSGFVKAIDDIISLFVGNSVSSGIYNTRSWAGYPLSENNPLPKYYNRVEEFKGTEAANIGKTVYEFVDFQDRPASVKELKSPYSLKQRFEGASIGLPKRILTYSANGELVRDVRNVYQYLYVEHVDTTLLSCKCAATTRVTPFTAASPATVGYDTLLYYPMTGRTELTKTTTRNYFEDGNFSETAVVYEYEPNYYNLRKITTTSSNNDRRENRMYYPYDYTNNTVLTKMIGYNEVNIPVSSETWIIDQNNSAKMVDGQFSNFMVQTDGDIQPTSVFKFFSNKPIAESVIGVFNNTLNRAPAYFKEQAVSTYDSNGNVIQVDEKGFSSNFKYDSSHHVLAATSNATSKETAFTGFEPNTMSGWILGAQPSVDESSNILRTPGPMTGSYFYYLKAGQPIKKTATDLVSGKKYKLSYWVTTYPTISGGPDPATLNYSNTVKKLYSYGKYALYEHTFTMGTTDLIISGTYPIDNLRLLPADATMTTYEYNEVGKVAFTFDGNNNIFRYEYDAKGRVINIYNQFSLIRHFEFNY